MCHIEVYGNSSVNSNVISRVALTIHSRVALAVHSRVALTVHSMAHSTAQKNQLLRWLNEKNKLFIVLINLFRIVLFIKIKNY